MKMKKITPKQANRINLRNGMETWEDDGCKTYWATDVNETGTYSFESVSERNEFLNRHNNAQ